MYLLRRTGLVIVAAIFAFSLSVFGLSFGIERIFGKSDHIKHAIESSGAYNSVIGNALDEAQKQSAQDQSGGGRSEIPLNDPGIRDIINKSLPPEYLQQQTERLLDGSYEWLQGKTGALTVGIDLTDAKTRLADGVADYTKQRLNGLPACPKGQGGSADDLDIFKATCLPRGADINTIAEKARQQISGGDFLKNPHINAHSIKVGNDQTIAQKFANAPSIYLIVRNSIYGLGAVALLTGLGVLMLSENRRAGLKKISITGISVGISLTISGLLIAFFSGNTLNELASSQGEINPLGQTVLDIIRVLAGDLRTWWMGFGITLIVLGIGGLVALRFSKPKMVGDDDDRPADSDKIEEKVEPKAKIAGEESKNTKNM